MSDLGTPGSGTPGSGTSAAGAGALANGPESHFVVEAVDALLRGDVVGARMALIAGADVAGWGAVAHRIDVAGRALTTDAGLTPETVPDEIDLVPEVLASTVRDSQARAPHLLGRWSDPATTGDLPLESVWPSLAMLAWLVDQAGFPAEVVV